MTNQYETVFIMTPVLSEEQMKEAVSSSISYWLKKELKLFLKTTGDYVNWLIPYKKSPTGFYYLIEFKADSNVG